MTIKHQSGFSLVELAIVLTVIGLLIGGVLKGQELIENARVNATIAQVKTFENAIVTFRKIYGELPGDFQNPTTRLTSCSAAPCGQNGNGDGLIGGNAPTAVQMAAAAAENRTMWLHLARAGLLNVINANYTGTPNQWGTDFPRNPIRGGWHIRYTNQTAAVNTPYPASSNHTLRLQYGVADFTTTQALTAAQAFKIDSKMDDGNGIRGKVMGNGPTVCRSAVYAANDKSVFCDVNFTLPF